MFAMLQQRYHLRPLDPARGVKPLDFGGGGINGSITRDGRWVAINRYHPGHGYVTLTSVPPFDESLRHDAGAVRAYRRRFAEDDGFGLTFTERIVRREAWLVEDAVPHIRLTLANGITAEATTFVRSGETGVTQIWQFSEPGDYVRLSGTVWLMRCPYTQLTEGGVLPMPPVAAHVFYERMLGACGLKNGDLPFVAWMVGIHQMTANPDGSASIGAEVGVTNVPTSAPNQRQTHIGMGMDAGEAMVNASGRRDSMTALHETLSVWRERRVNAEPVAHPLELAQRRGRVYGLNCAVPTGSDPDSPVCILTDHLLLPLSWNRDAYYVALALLSSGSHNANTREETEMARDIVRRHLLWMFEFAERPGGFWGRSHLANGRVKDRGFQLDQQIFPLLELADYTLMTDERGTLDRLSRHIDPLLDALITRKADFAWLFPTDETPADDPIAQPYHFSSHVLLWWTLSRLGRLGLPRDFGALAAAVKADIGRYFVTTHRGRDLYAYATDGRGGYHFYHDANDLPLALAPGWGFCSPDDPVWRATVDFAFSDANQGGFYAGVLGSVHTPSPWALGDLQDLIIAQQTQDEARATAARERLVNAMQWDGALPEAYDAATGAVVSRHWFAWTNAVLVGCGLV